MKLKLLALLSPLMLTACGSYDCNSSDVRETIIEMFVNDAPKEAEELFQDAKFAGVVTLATNEDTGYYACKADITVGLMDGRSVTREMNYEVSRVESGESDFEVSVNQSEFNMLGWTVNGPINQSNQTRAHEEKQSARRAAYAENPPVPVSDADAAAQIKAALKDGDIYFDESAFHLLANDLNEDGLKEFIALWRSSAPGNETEEWDYTTFRQHASEPGAQAKLDYGYENRRGFTAGRAVRQYDLAGGQLTVSDGAGWSETIEVSGGPFNPNLNE